MSDDSKNLQSELPKHGVVARIIHWSTGALVVYGFAKGLDNVNQLEDPQLWIFEVLFAFVLGAILAARFIWMRKFNKGASRLPETAPKWQHSLSWLGHNAIYVGMGTIILSGLAIAGLYYSPLQNSFMMDGIIFIHNASVALTQIVIIGHVLAALYHYFWLKDGVMQTMTSLKK